MSKHLWRGTGSPHSPGSSGGKMKSQPAEMSSQVKKDDWSRWILNPECAANAVMWRESRNGKEQVPDSVPLLQTMNLRILCSLSSCSSAASMQTVVRMCLINMFFGCLNQTSAEDWKTCWKISHYALTNWSTVSFLSWWVASRVFKVFIITSLSAWLFFIAWSWTPISLQQNKGYLFKIKQEIKNSVLIIQS